MTALTIADLAGIPDLHARAAVLAAQIPVPPSGFHYTLGAYNTPGCFKSNGVDPAHLVDHIEYNLMMRPGRALFVDGKCLFVGYLGHERCLDIEQQDIARRTATRCTAPYQ